MNTIRPDLTTSVRRALALAMLGPLHRDPLASDWRPAYMPPQTPGADAHAIEMLARQGLIRPIAFDVTDRGRDTAALLEVTL